MTVGELKEIIAQKNFEDDTPVIIVDSYSGACIDNFEIKNNSNWHLQIIVNVEEYI